MKKVLFAVLFSSVAMIGQAQSIKEEIQYVQEIWGKEKKALVADAMKLSTDEGNKFWPLFDAYQVERKKIGEDRLMAIKGYAEAYDNMTDDKAKELGNMFLKNNAALNKLQTSYMKKVSKAVSPIRAVQFLQLEGYVDSQIRAVIADALPFMPDPKK